MTPVDYRNATWEDVRGRVSALRLTVYQALIKHGPATTRQLAMRSGIDILTVRPRVTELHDLGWVSLCGSIGNEGAYRALTEDEARRVFARRRAEAVGTLIQAELL